MQYKLPQALYLNLNKSHNEGRRQRKQKTRRWESKNYLEYLLYSSTNTYPQYVFQKCIWTDFVIASNYLFFLCSILKSYTLSFFLMMWVILTFGLPLIHYALNMYNVYILYCIYNMLYMLYTYVTYKCPAEADWK